MNPSRFKKVLFPTDFSKMSGSALKTAIEICKRQQAELTLVHVLDYYKFISSDIIFTSGKITNDYINYSTENLMSLVSHLIDKTGLKIHGITKSGDISDEICKTASELNSDLIIMGTHGTSGLREFFMGSNAFRVVKNAPCPVLTIRGDWEKTTFDKIIFPVRLIEGTLEKYEFVKPVITKNDSKLIIAGLTGKNKPADVRKIKKLVEGLKKQLKPDNIKYSVRYLSSSNFADRILSTAKVNNADLIVVTANLDYEFKDFFMGVFAQQIINHSKYPVLSIRHDLEKIKPDTILKDKEKLSSEDYLKLVLKTV